MTPPRLRRATLADVPAMAACFLAARRSLLAIVPMVHPDESVGPWIAGNLFTRTSLWVGEGDIGVAAMMSLSPGWLEHLYVHPDQHSGGLGSALLGLAKRQDEAASGLQLWTFQANAGARRFYERHGFAAVEFTDGSGNEERTPDVRYAWPPPATPGS
jgi:GNAT superfamily N-acetyltransferase